MSDKTSSRGAEHDTEIALSAAYTLEVNATDSGGAIDLAGVTEIVMMVRYAANSAGAPLINATLTGGEITITAPTTLGQFVVQIPEATLESLQVSESITEEVDALYEIEVTESTGRVRQYMHGCATLVPGVARPNLP